MDRIGRKLSKLTKLRFNESMKKHTSFKTGGKVRYYLEPSSTTELVSALEVCNANMIPVFVVGNGSNLLFPDDDMPMAALSLSGFDGITIHGNIVVAGAGLSLFKLCEKLKNEGLSGLEFLYGIPGTVGGAIVQNAGAYGGEIGDCVENVTILDENKLLRSECMWFEYRNSVFKKEKHLIVEAIFKLKRSTKEEVEANMRECFLKRRQSQPLAFPNAGSIFKRNGGIIPARLIDLAGLKGLKIGGAEVSEKHAGFIVNTGDATSGDILSLIKQIKKTILFRFNIVLEEEIEIVGTAN